MGDRTSHVVENGSRDESDAHRFRGFTHRSTRSSILPPEEFATLHLRGGSAPLGSMDLLAPETGGAGSLIRKGEVVNLE